MQELLFGYAPQKGSKSTYKKKSVRKIHCLVCKKEIITSSAIKKYCGPECVGKAEWTRDKRYHAGAKKIRQCPYCLKEFYFSGNGHPAVYCSKKCCKNWLARKRRERLKARCKSDVEYAALQKELQKRNSLRNAANKKRRHYERMANDPEYAAKYKHRIKLAREAYKVRNPHKYRKSKDKNRRFRLYGLTEKQFHEMIAEQNFCCALCQRPFEKSKQTVVDHCHKTGKIRAILCLHCNTGLGYWKDNPVTLARAIRYLKKHSQPNLVALTGNKR